MARAQGHRENEIFRTDELFGHNAFAAEFFQERLREKNRSDRPAKVVIVAQVMAVR